VKFTEQGGTVTVRLTNDGKDVQIAITDTGIGIAESEMPKLFTKFHRGTSTLHYDFEGTGIGLYSSKVIIERQGGTIHATSQEGKGSTFIITLPISSGGAPHA
jgi:signal transduction histidine kinase